MDGPIVPGPCRADLIFLDFGRKYWPSGDCPVTERSDHSFVILGAPACELTPRKSSRRQMFVVDLTTIAWV
jgi:hypothetical protein